MYFLEYIPFKFTCITENISKNSKMDYIFNYANCRLLNIQKDD